MTYMLSPKALHTMDMEEVCSSCKGGYFHIAPKITKIAVINLGMQKESFMDMVNMKCSLNVFDEDFSINQLNMVPHDVVMVSNGKVDAEKMPMLVDKIKTLIGKKKIFGIGLGQELVKEAAAQAGAKAWKQEGTIMISEDHKLYCCDMSQQNQLEEIMKYA